MRATASLAPFVLVLPLLLAACASGNRAPSYQAEYDRLNADCIARGGILSPTGGVSGRPQTDNVCRITGGGSRIPNN